MKWILRGFAVALILSAFGCGKEPGGPEAPPSRVDISLKVIGAETTEVRRVTIEVTADGSVLLEERDLDISDNKAEGDIYVPAGSSRTFTARLYDADNQEIGRADTTVDVPVGEPISIELPIIISNLVHATVTWDEDVIPARVGVEVSAAEGVIVEEQNLDITENKGDGDIDVPAGSSRTFTARLYDADNQEIASADTTMDVPAGEKISVELRVIVSNVRVTIIWGEGAAEIFGIYTERPIPKVIPDSTGFVGIYYGGGGTFDEFVDDTDEFKEGEMSKRSTMTVGSGGPWAGWFVQHGKDGTPDSSTKDMSSFAGGHLRFWVKSPIDLLVGIRSGNVRAGQERSTVLLSSYDSFSPDNQWHQVSIPLSDFVGPSPKADLSQIKIFFNVASNAASGGTGGSPKTFWIDDIVWAKPGH